MKKGSLLFLIYTILIIGGIICLLIFQPFNSCKDQKPDTNTTTNLDSSEQETPVEEEQGEIQQEEDEPDYDEKEGEQEGGNSEGQQEDQQESEEPHQESQTSKYSIVIIEFTNGSTYNPETNTITATLAKDGLFNIIYEVKSDEQTTYQMLNVAITNNKLLVKNKFSGLITITLNDNLAKGEQITAKLQIKTILDEKIFIEYNVIIIGK